MWQLTSTPATTQNYNKNISLECKKMKNKMQQHQECEPSKRRCTCK